MSRSNLLPFTIFRRAHGPADFDVVRRIHAPDHAAATAEALRTLAAPIVCHARTGLAEAVDFATVPAPRRSRRFVHAPS